MTAFKGRPAFTAGLPPEKGGERLGYGKPYLRDELEELRDKIIVSPGVKVAGFIVDSAVDRRKDVMRRVLKEVKTKESGNAPKILTDTARAPKELAKRSMLQAKERARIASQRPETQQDDSPDRYAENRVEQTSEVIAHKTAEGGKNTVRKANDIRKQGIH